MAKVQAYREPVVGIKFCKKLKMVTVGSWHIVLLSDTSRQHKMGYRQLFWDDIGFDTISLPEDYVSLVYVSVGCAATRNWGHLNTYIKMLSYQFMDFYYMYMYKDETFSCPFYLYNGNRYTRKHIFLVHLYWKEALVIFEELGCICDSVPLQWYQCFVTSQKAKPSNILVGSCEYDKEILFCMKIYRDM